MIVQHRSRHWRPATAVACLWLTGCASGVQPVSMPVESALQPADAALWQAVADAGPEDWFAPLSHGPTALDWRLRAIDSATTSVDLQTFLWKLDLVGEQIRKHLLDAAARGVSIRILLDDSFILDTDQALLDLDGHPDIELKVFNPYQRRSSDAALREILNAGDFFRLDHRMHNKAMIVDNRVALIGGRNLASEYFGYHPANNFRDMEVVTWGTAVPALSAGFDSYWNNGWSFPISTLAELQPDAEGSTAKTGPPAAQASHRELEPDELRQTWLTLAHGALPGSAVVLLDTPPPADPTNSDGAPVQVGRQLLEAIERAEHNVWLVSAYLIPTPALEAAIARAEARGVEVRILTNSISSNNHLSAHSAYRNHMRELLSAGAELHEVRADAEDRHRYMAPPVEDKGLGLHAKLLLLDNHSSFVGTANLDPRSLRINTEMGLLIESPALNRELRRRLEPDFAPRNAWRVQLDDDGRISWHSDSETRYHQPTHSYMRQLEDWVMSLLPIEGEM